MSFKVTNWVWARSESRNGARLVLLALADRADDNGCAWPSIDDLAERTKLSPRAVQKAIATLVESGELEVQNGGGRHRSNRYRILPKPRTSDGVTDEEPRTNDGVSPEETPNFAPETPNFEAETLNFETGNPVQSSPEPPVEPSREPSENHHTYRATDGDRLPDAEAEKRLPEEIVRLQGAMSTAGINLPWKFLGDDMIRVINDVRRLGIPLMIEQALKAEQGATKPPFSSRWFYDGWHAIPTPVDLDDADTSNVISLRNSPAVNRQQQETDDMFARALARAEARMQQESS